MDREHIRTVIINKNVERHHKYNSAVIRFRMAVLCALLFLEWLIFGSIKSYAIHNHIERSEAMLENIHYLVVPAIIAGIIILLGRCFVPYKVVH